MISVQDEKEMEIEDVVKFLEETEVLKLSYNQFFYLASFLFDFFLFSRILTNFFEWFFFEANLDFEWNEPKREKESSWNLKKEISEHL